MLVNSCPPGQNGRNFVDAIFRCIFVNENVSILIEISLKCISKGPIDNKSALILVMAHRHWPHVNVCRASCGGVFNMLLVLSITFYFHYNIWGCTCSTGPFQYWWLKGYINSSCYYHHHDHQIGSIHLSHCYHIFQWLCAWDVCYIIFCYLLHIHSGKTGNLFSSLLCSLWWVQIAGCVLAWRSHSFICA